MAKFESFWTKNDGGFFKRKTQTFVSARATTWGYNELAYFVVSEAREKDERFIETTSLMFSLAENGNQVAISRFLAFCAEMNSSGATEIVPAETVVILPRNVAPFRPKTDAEKALDKAMLSVESDEYDRAEALLAQAGPAQNSLFGLTVARRLFANKAAFYAESADAAQRAQAHAFSSRAVASAQMIFDQLAHLTEGLVLYEMKPYGFGDDYRSAQSHLVYATQTIAEHKYKYENDAESALAIVRVGESTNHAHTELYEFIVKCLMKLGRETEAFETHLKWSCNVAEIAENPRYIAYAVAEKIAYGQKQQAKLDSITHTLFDGTPATPKQISAIEKKFGALPADYVKWVTQKRGLAMERTYDGYTTRYDALIGDAVADAHESFLGWIHLHDNSSPQLAAELHAEIAAQGINPQKMLPIVSEESAAAYYLLRLDGEARGKIYAWDHEETCNFEIVADGAKDLFWALQKD